MDTGFLSNLQFNIGGLGAVYSAIACFTWALSLAFSIEYLKKEEHRARYYVFTIITFTGFVGTFLAGNYLTLFLFFEIMSLASYVWVAQEETKGALKAAGTYLAIAVIGGLTMLLGIMLYYADAKVSPYLTYGLIAFGFAAKAGVFPLHIWLPKSHPVAPAPASALLSGMLTKAGVLGLLTMSFGVFSGDQIWGRAMLVLGLITMLLGAVLALFSTDLKRTLACSSMSQIGFIMTGIGVGTMENASARTGVLLHMFNHSLFKFVLFLAAGVVVMNIHRLELNEIKGFGRNKTFLKIVFATGALGISGVPLFSGYISKTLLHEGIVEGLSYLGSFGRAVEWIFLISGGCTLAYMLKLFIAVFVEENEDKKVQAEYDEIGKNGYMSLLSGISVGAGAVLIVVFGIVPGLTMHRMASLCTDALGMGEDVSIGLSSYFTWECLKGSLISITIGILIYYLFVRKCLMKDGRYLDRWNKRLDLEELIYRPLLLTVLVFIGTFIARILDKAVDFTVFLLRSSLFSEKPIPREYAEGNAFTHLVGDTLDRRYRALRGHDLSPVDTYEHRLAMWYYRFSENHNIISRSLSFGLALASIGLLITLGYLLSPFLFR